MRYLHKILQGIFLILFVSGVVLSAAGSFVIANHRAHSLQSLSALEKDLVAPTTDFTQIKKTLDKHMASIDERAARQRTAFHILYMGLLYLLPGFLGLTIYTALHLIRRPKLTARDAIWKLRRNEQYALCLLVLGLALVAFGGSNYAQNTRDTLASATEASALTTRLANTNTAMTEDLMSRVARGRQRAMDTLRQGTNALTCMSFGFAACGMGLIALWFMTLRTGTIGARARIP